VQVPATCFSYTEVSNMRRRHFLIGGSGLFASALLPVLSTASENAKAKWKALLPAASYRILFEEDTEPPGSSPLNAEKRAGTYVCAACYQPLFDSSAKFESGTGWPSFYAHLPEAIATKTDYKQVWPRKEYHCTRCHGHQGHVFDDGPKPTGLRYCNNGVALRFVAKSEKLPELRG
jgi:peptide-methionine (R)-S-oxide reductase